MERSVVKDLADSVIEVFSKIVSIQLNRNPVERSEDEVRQSQIMGMVGLAGRSMGIVSLHCSPKMAMTIASRMLGAEVTRVADEAKDAIGEVTNMVAGNFKTRMSRGGQMFDLSVPTVIVGDSYTTKTMTDAPSVVLEFEWQGETIYVKLNLKK